MFIPSSQAAVRNFCGYSLRLLFATLLFVVPLTSPVLAQGSGIDLTGTGGAHTIQGRIYFPSGRQAETLIKVKLESTNSGELSVLADANGSFAFRSLEPGSYTVIIEGGDQYETLRENIFIDKDVGHVRSGARNIIVPIYLLPKRSARGTKPGVLNAALASVPAPARELYNKALESAHAGDSKKAIEQLKNALSYYPEFALALNELGVQYLRLGQADKAVEALRAALKISPDDFTSRLNYGIALLEKKDFAEAEKQLRQAIKKNETSPTAHMYLGLTMISLRNYEEAQKELERAITVGGDALATVHYYLGGLLWSKKEYKRAADELEKYLKLIPNAANAERTRSAIKELRNKQ